MEWKNFERNIKLLSTHTGKSITQKQAQLLYRRLKVISDDGFDTICEQLLTECKMIPSAFPTVGQLMKAWYEFKRNHHAFEYDKPDPCDYCRGTGMGYRLVKDEETGQVTKLLGLCRKCDNWHRVFSEAAITNVSADGVVIDTTTRDYPGRKFFLPFVQPKPRPGDLNYKQRYVQALLDGIGCEF